MQEFRSLNIAISHLITPTAKVKKEDCQKGELELCGSTSFCSSVKEVKSVPIAPRLP